MIDAEAWCARGTHHEVFGHRVFVVDEGPRDGPVLVVLHGYPTSSHDYEPVLPVLTRAGYRVILHDHLGFGLSDKPARYSYSLVEQAEVALEVWRQLGVEGGVLVAHDYGTSVATELLARRERGGLPWSVSRVVLCNGSMHIELAKPRLIQHLLRSEWTGPTVARFASRALFARNMRAILGKPEVLDDSAIDAMWSLLERADGRARMPQITRYLDERRRLWDRWIGALTRLDLPTLVLWGPLDPVALPAIAEQVAKETPGATLQWLDGLGHYPMLEAPAVWGDAVVAFAGLGASSPAEGEQG